MVATALAASTSETVANMTIEPVGVGLVAFGALIALLLVTYAFRSVGHRN